MIMAVVRLLNEMLAKEFIPLFTSFYTSHVVGNGISEPSTSMRVVWDMGGWTGVDHY